jgi:DNA-directed RNA polymerase specialized sigma24 family protein
MSNSKRSGSDDGGVDAIANVDTELSDILKALFCACLNDLQPPDSVLRRDLFRLTDLEGQTLDKAAQALGIGVPEAKKMLVQTRREIAMVMVLGLGKPSKARPNGEAPFDDCDC